MLVERLYSLGEWAKANPVKTTAIVAAGVIGLTVLLVPDVRHGLINYLRQVTDVDGALKFQECMSQQAKNGAYGSAASLKCSNA
ncbi:MAG TPA: hypothetical protein HA224_02010 [Nanoarchaeota archaeon]|nr:hypothetical protein [Nanoarchaeota archaeon]